MIIRGIFLIAHDDNVDNKKEITEKEGYRSNGDDGKDCIHNTLSLQSSLIVRFYNYGVTNAYWGLWFSLVSGFWEVAPYVLLQTLQLPSVSKA